ncbi:hypothetical protein ACET3X_005427 [Alternaria dauci]|uniref:Uncharacterized protein n=1 Tax=Alternaria dauci TaxID=48095 RepID=A0ABR3UKX3_9PLEO
MTFENQGRGAADSPELTDSAGLEEMTATNDEEQIQREANDHRLAQAINYLAQEGGSDSPATFMDRVDRIDNSLLLPLTQQGRNFDVKLFNRVLDMVSQAQLDFDKAAQGDSSEEDSSSISDGEFSMPEGVQGPPKYHTPSAPEALYRKTEKPVAKRRERVPNEHMYKYGGPENEVETWYKNYPASLPFPETFQLADWESIKMDYDLSESVKHMKAKGKIVETHVPFDHPALQRYKTLPSYESGSHFKLPKPSAIVDKEVNRLGTPESLAKVVQKLNQNNDEVNAEGQYRYAPRIFLEKFTVGTQVDPTTIRHAVNTTPTKLRTSTIGSNSQRDPANTTRKGPASRTPRQPILKPSTTAISQACEGDISRSSTKHTDLAPPTSRVRAISPVVRKIERERATSLERSPRRKSGVSTAPPSPDSPTKKAAVHKQPVTEKRPGHRAVEPTASVPSKLQSVPESINVATPKNTTKTPIKRKRSVSEQDYVDDNKRPKSNKSSVPKSSVKTRAQGTPNKPIPSVPEETDEDHVTEAF